MRGTVLQFDDERGVIAGADGNRYAFGRDELRQLVRLGAGTGVEFQADGANAREIFVAEGVASAAPSRFGRDALLVAAANTDLWSYFWRGVTTNYANFSGRAPRKEFWSYIAFWTIAFIVLVIGGFVIEAEFGGLDILEMTPVGTLAASGLFLAATLVPWIALTVRRLHDVGLTGWLALLIHPLMVIWLGYLLLLVIGLIPSQAQDNKWGPAPVGGAA